MAEKNTVILRTADKHGLAGDIKPVRASWVFTTEADASACIEIVRRAIRLVEDQGTAAQATVGTEVYDWGVKPRNNRFPTKQEDSDQ